MTCADGTGSAGNKGVSIKGSLERAFTVLELVVIILLLMALAALVLPILSGRPDTGIRINCTNNLKQIGLSFKIWSLDNQDRLPMEVPTAEGGAKESLERGLVCSVFEVMSNELSTPKVLLCPQDTARHWPSNACWALTDKNISYFVCQRPDPSGRPGLLAGDRNLTNQVVRNYVPFTRELSLGWTEEMHCQKGTVGFVDGQVDQFANDQLVIKRQGKTIETNRLLVP